MAFTKVEYRGLDAGHVGIKTAGGLIGVGFTMLNFIGAGNTFAISPDGTTVDISIAGGGIGIGTTGGVIGVGATMLNFIGAGNTFSVSPDGTTIDISIAGGGGGSSEILKETFNVSSTQSVFNITNGQFDAGFLEVYVNGVKLPSSDFTENPPTQFTLALAAEAGDIVEILGFKSRGTSTSIDADITNLNATGIVTAAQFVGDGSRITGVIGLGTAITANTPVLGNIFYRNNTLSVGATVTMDVPNNAETNVGYTHHSDLAVEEGCDFIVADGDDFIADVLGIGTDVAPLPSNGGRIRADNFTNRAGSGAPTFPLGINIGDGSYDTGFLEVPNVLDVTTDKTLLGSSSSTVMVQRKAVVISDTKSLILGPDCELVINTLQI